MATYQFARASHQYDAKGDTELSLLPGDVVRIHSKFNNGWMFAEKNDGSKGVCPIDYASEIKASDAGLRVIATSNQKGKDSSQLSFNKGEYIQVLETFPTGWWKGSLESQPSVIGLFPVNVVDVLWPAQSDGVRAAQQSTTPVQPSTQAPTTTSSTKQTYFVRAIADYTATSARQLSLTEGGLMEVLEEAGGGWLRAQDPTSKAVGLIPSNYVEKADPPTPVNSAPSTTVSSSLPAASTTPLSIPLTQAKRPSISIPNTQQIVTPVSAPTQPPPPLQAPPAVPQASVIVQQPNPVPQPQPTAQPQQPQTPTNTASNQWATALHDFNGEGEPELNFKQGQNMRILGKLSLGWLKAELNGKSGHVPEEFVKLLDQPPPEARPQPATPQPAVVAAVTSPAATTTPTTTTTAQPVVEHKRESKGGETKHNPKQARRSNTLTANSVRDLKHGIKQSANGRLVRALYAFQGQSNNELSFEKGAEFLMLEKLEKGWCKGVIGDHVGIFPESYVESAESDVQRQAPAIAVARAIHDFAGGQNALWLTFAKGDLIEVLSMETGKGWWHGRLQNGKSGVFPANYVKIEENLSRPAQTKAVATPEPTKESTHITPKTDLFIAKQSPMNKAAPEPSAATTNPIVKTKSSSEMQKLPNLASAPAPLVVPPTMNKQQSVPATISSSPAHQANNSVKPATPIQSNQTKPGERSSSVPPVAPPANKQLGELKTSGGRKDQPPSPLPPAPGNAHSQAHAAQTHAPALSQHSKSAASLAVSPKEKEKEKDKDKEKEKDKKEKEDKHDKHEKKEDKDKDEERRKKEKKDRKKRKAKELEEQVDRILSIVSKQQRQIDDLQRQVKELSQQKQS